MAARIQEQPLCFAVVVSFLFLYSFFLRLLLGVNWPILTKLCHMVIQIHKMYPVYITLGEPSQKLAVKKLQNFESLTCNLIANVSGTQPDIDHRPIVNRNLMACKLRLPVCLFLHVHIYTRSPVIANIADHRTVLNSHG